MNAPIRHDLLASVAELRTPYGVLRTFTRPDGASLNDLFAALKTPVGVPVLAVVDGVPVLRADGGWDVVPPAKAQVSFLALPGGGGSKDIIRLVAVVALAVAAPYASGALLELGLGAIGGLEASQLSLSALPFVSQGITAGLTIGGIVGITALLSNDVATAQNTNPSPTYSLTPTGNIARLEQEIPRLYGEHAYVPDYAAPPWSYYQDNQQYLCQLFSLGVGEYEVSRVDIGKTVLWTSDDGLTGNFVDVEVEFYDPGETVSLYSDIMVTSGEVSGQEIRNEYVNLSLAAAGHTITGPADTFKYFLPGDDIIIIGGSNAGAHLITDIAADGTSITVAASLVTQTASIEIQTDTWLGPFPACAAAETCDQLAFDFVLPKGLFYLDDDGAKKPMYVVTEGQARQIDEAGVAISDWSTVLSRTYTETTTDSIRRTETASVSAARWEARCRRTSLKDHRERYGNDIIWAGFKSRLPDDHVYDDVSTMALRMRATNQLSVASSRQIRVIQMGKVPTWTGSEWTIPIASRSIAWAVADILRNDIYGNGKNIPDSMIDIDKLAELDDLWTGRGDYFDGVFDTTRTMWESISLVLRAGRSQPVLVGDKITFIRDEPKTLARGVFNPAAMVRGSFSVNHMMVTDNTPDAIIVQYIDRRTWEPAEILCSLPDSTAEKPIRLQLFGITDRSQAWREGITLATANARRRIFASFKTELAGRLLMRGDKALVGSELMHWSQGGVVLEFDGTDTLTLSELPTIGTGSQIILARRDGWQWGPATIVPVTGDVFKVKITDAAAVAAAQGVALADVLAQADDLIQTRYLIGASDTEFKAFLLIAGRPIDANSIDLAFVNDDPSVYSAEIDNTEPDADDSLDHFTGPTLTGLALAYVSGTDPVTISLTFTAVAGASQYIAEVSYDNRHWSEEVYRGAGLTTNIAVNAGTVYVRGAAVDASGQGRWLVRSGTFGTPASLPAVPGGVTLTADAFAITARWNSAARALTYTAELYSESVPGSGTYDTLESTQAGLTGLTGVWTSEDISTAGGPWPNVRVKVYGVNGVGTSAAGTATVTTIDTSGSTTDAKLDALVALPWAADTAPYFTGIDTIDTYPISLFSRDLAVNADAIAWRAALDVADYEFGSWTGAIAAQINPSDLTVVLSANDCTFLRIGRKVVAKFDLVTSTFTYTIAAGQMFITGLPFPADGDYGAQLNFSGITKAGYTVFQAVTGTSSTGFVVECGASGSPIASLLITDMPSGTVKVLRAVVTYFT